MQVSLLDSAKPQRCPEKRGELCREGLWNCRRGFREENRGPRLRSSPLPWRCRGAECTAPHGSELAEASNQAAKHARVGAMCAIFDFFGAWRQLQLKETFGVEVMLL